MPAFVLKTVGNAASHLNFLGIIPAEIDICASLLPTHYLPHIPGRSI